MNRVIVFFHVFAVLWLAGFGVAALTAGAPVAVVCGSLGLLGFLGAVVARIGAEEPPTPRRSGPVGRGG